MKIFRLAFSALLLLATSVSADTLPAVNTTLGGGLAVCSAVLCGAGGSAMASLRSANFNTVADQAIALPTKITAYQLTSVLVTNCSANLTLAAGGFYTAASKGGTVLVLAVQAYSALSAATIILNPTLTAAAAARLTAATIYLRLTTAQGGAATCDVYLFGNDLT